MQDASRDPRFGAPNTAEGAAGPGFYAGVPLRVEGGPALGALCILDATPRSFTPEHGASLQVVADVLAEALAESSAEPESGVASLLPDPETAVDANLMQAALNTLDDLFFVIDLQGRLVRWNEKLRRITGYTDAALRHLPLTDLLQAEELPHVYQALRRGWRHGHAAVDATLVTAEGRRLAYHFSGSVLRDASGQRVGLCGTGHDLSGRLAIEAAIRSSEGKYRDFFERANAPVLIIDPEDETILEANPEACKTYGFSREEFIGMSLKTLTVDITRGEDELRHIMEKGGDQSFESLHYRRDGSTFHILFNCSYFAYDGRGAVLCFGQDISARKRYEEELLLSKMQAEEMARLKDAMLSNMSHEIRTPLTGILGFADVLAEEVQGETQEFVDLIRQSGQRLMETLNSVLDLAQLESGAFDLELQPVDVGAQARDTARLMQPLAAERGLTIQLTGPDRAASALLDGAAFNRILSNLLSNAIKFTPSGGIFLDIDAGPEDVTVELRDTGIGIAEDFLPHLFDAFRQESGGLARDFEGNGLGLAIVKRLVELMHGTIQVRSVKHEGTTFTIRFPRLKQDVAAGSPVAELSGVAIHPAPRRRVLIVEDNTQTRRLLGCLLGERYDVLLAGDTEEALAAARQAPLDLVVLDINLGPTQSGFDVIRKLRQMPEHAHVPVVACTAYARSIDMERFIQAGFNGYVGKPFTRELLYEAIETCAESGAPDNRTSFLATARLSN